MRLTEARAVLDVSRDDDWATIKAAYRLRIGASHPDRAGDAGIDRTVALNAAYRTLSLAHRAGRLHQADDGADDGASRSAGPPPAPRRRRVVHRPTDAPADDVRILDATTLVLDSPPETTFRRLVEAVNALGEISYIDRSSAIFEAVLRLDDGTPASLVVSLQWRAHDATCEAFCTLEALDRAETLDVSGVLAQLVPFIPPDLGD